MSFFSVSRTKADHISMAYLHSHDYYELYFQLSGSRLYFCNNKYYHLQANTLVVTKPDVLHKFENGPYERFLISISSDFLSANQIAFLDSLDKNMLTRLAPESMPDILQTLQDICELYDSLSENYQVIVSLKLGLLFHQIYTANIGTVEPETSLQHDLINYAISPTILKIMDFIKKNYHKKFSLSDLCNEYALSKTWLCKCFMQATNMTIFEYKARFQTNEAKRLLIETNFSIEKIALSLGFSSSGHFCMVFKKYTNTTPLNWRKQLLPKH